MPDTKITALTALTTADPANDMMPIVDVSDTTMAASGTTKRISINNILACSPSATLASATITGNLTVDTNTLFVDAANNRVGILTASPAYPFQVNGRISYNAGIGEGADLTLSSSGTVLQLGAGSAWAETRHYVLGAEAMRLNSTGLLVGTNATGYGAAGRGLVVAGGSTSAILALRLTSGDSGYLLGDATKVELGSNGSVPLTFSNGGVRMTIDTSGNVGVGVTPSAGRGAIQLSAGIGFPATQVASSDANTLDDYEEGTWTPTITAGSGTPTTVTVNSSTYTKIGRMVVCTFDISVVAVGTASSSLQFGLPFTSITSTAFCGSFREDGSTGNMGMVFYSTGTTAACLLYNNATPWVNGYRLKGTYTYFAA